ncbi:hypothetical protein OURE66S_01483 [Oligella ureolytica]
MKNKTLHLIPVGLSDSPTSEWLPQNVRQLAAKLDCYIAENAKTARAFLKLIETEHTLQEITIHSLSNKTPTQEIQTWLKAIPEGGEIGLVSEAGCPAVADPDSFNISLCNFVSIYYISLAPIRRKSTSHSSGKSASTVSHSPLMGCGKRKR